VIAAPHCSCDGLLDMDLGPCPIHGSKLTRMELDGFKNGAAHWKSEHDRVRSALAELVRLKDGPRDDAYRGAKDAAWDAARAALSPASRENGETNG
jgi:hypothetical protein